MAVGTTIRFALDIRRGYRGLVCGQLETTEGDQLFLFDRRGHRRQSPFIVPLVDAPVKVELSPEANFCGFCGQARLPNARFCGACGKPFAEKSSSDTAVSEPFATRILELAHRIVQMQEGAPDTTQGFTQLGKEIFSVARSGLAGQELSEEQHARDTTFLKYLEGLFDHGDHKIERIIDGVAGKQDASLSLAQAQRLGQKIDSGEMLTTEDESTLRLLLTRAPLSFGYWAPFKKILKSVPPERYPSEFAKAAARLTDNAKPMRPHGEKEQYLENLSGLSFLGKVASRGTREYLRRHQLREYRRLAESQPNSFVPLATEYLLEIDKQAPGLDIIEAFILNGTGVFRDQWSRRGIELTDGQVFTPPAQPGWDAHADYLSRLWITVVNRSEIQSFAFQGLVSRNAILPGITAKQLTLALRSRHKPLITYACDQIVLRPEAWKELRGEDWDTLISHTDENTRSTFLEHRELPLLAIRSFVEFGGSELAAKAIDLFINRSSHWEGASYSLSDELWLQLISRADSSQIHRLFERVFSQVEAASYITGHLRSAISALEKTVEKGWDSHPAASGLAHLLITAAMSGRYESLRTEPLARAIFLLALRRNQLGVGWSAEWLGKIAAKVLASALVLISQDSSLSNTAQRSSSNGGSHLACDELTAEILRRIQASDEPSSLLEKIWLECAVDPRIEAGLWLLQGFPTNEHVSIALSAVYRIPGLTDAEKATLWTMILRESDGSSLASLRSGTAEEQTLWQAIDFGVLFGCSPQLRRALWEILGGPERDEWLEQALSAIIPTESFLQELTPDDFRSPSFAQIEALKLLLGSGEQQTGLSDRNALGAAMSESAEISAIGQAILRGRNMLPAVWLQLVESELPIPVATGFEALVGIKDKEALTDALLLALDSAVAPVRARGLELVDTLSDRINRERLFLSLSESTYPDIRNRVAEEALVAAWSNTPEVQSFDDRVLLVRREARKAKELVKQRHDGDIPENYQPTPERLKVLKDMALHGKPRDAEWAYRRLAQLLLAGVSIEHAEVSVVNQETNSG